MATSANVRFVPTQQSARRQSSHNCAEKLSDTGGESYRQGTPECHSGCGAQNVCTACSCPDRTQKGKKAQRSRGHDGTSTFAGDTTTMSKGIAAPTEKVAADVSAACTGRAA